MEDFNNTNHSSKDKLPPRSVYHAQNKGNEKNNYRIKLPFVRIISLAIIILIISLVSIKLFSDDSKPAATEPKVEDTPPISEIGKADDESEEEELEEKPSVVEEEEEEATTPSESTPVVTPSVSEKPATSTNEPSNSNSKPTTSTEQPSTSTPTTPPVNTEKPKVEYIEHVVTKEETLYRIAMKYFKSPSGVEIIQKHNGLSGTNIREGQVLKIPKQ